MNFDCKFIILGGLLAIMKLMELFTGAQVITPVADVIEESWGLIGELIVIAGAFTAIYGGLGFFYFLYHLVFGDKYNRSQLFDECKKKN